MKAVNVTVYRSSKLADTYLYLPQGEALEELPSALLERFGDGESFLEFELTEERYLAQADASRVLEALSNQGFYLQLPPPKYPPEEAE